MSKASKIVIFLDVLLLVVACAAVYIYDQMQENKTNKVPEQTYVAVENTNTPTPEMTPVLPSSTPTATITPSPTPRPDTYLTFTGDVLLTDYMINNYKKGGINGLVDDNLYNLLYNADINMIDEEFPFSKRGEPMKDKEYTFRTDPAYVSIFQDMGVDIVTLANNHSIDYGLDALLDTFSTLDAAGIRYVGAGKDSTRAKEIQYFSVNGLNIAVVAASRVIPVVEWNATSTRPGVLSTYDPTATCALIEEAKQKADYVVVYVHWGVEHTERPVEYQRNMGRQYIDSGADIVVGTHTHCLQSVEFYNGKAIVYSLGNFIFSRKTTDTAMIKLIIDGEGEIHLAMYPCKAVNGLTSMVTDAEEIKKFNQYIESISYDIKIDENQFLRMSK